MQDFFARLTYELLLEIASVDTEVILLAILLVMTVIVIDGVSAFARDKRIESGMTPQMSAVGIEGSKILPVRQYVSDMQKLAGKPDALIVEDGYIIPVERKPLAKKIHDRYVAQVLVYMRLVEEFEGKRPPYGYLILGPKCRRFKIENSDARQAWLQKIIDEMQGILAGKECVAAPHPRKCRKCDVRKDCAHDQTQDEFVQIKAKSSQAVAS